MVRNIEIMAAIFICLILLAANANPDAKSQETLQEATISITGTVVDSTTREGIPQAQIILEEEGESTSTDEYGSFYFSDVEVGTHSISVEAVNYRPAQERVEVTEEGATIEIQLDPEYE